jgi:hypothetical protein
MLVYHGTSEANVVQILQQGIMPRSLTSRSNWAHTVKSHEDAVYLTIAYPLHFANQACTDKERLAVLEIDTDLLDEERLVADEDAVEQALRGHDNLPVSWGMKRRTKYYRDRIHQYPHVGSLKALGTCAHLGVIGKHAIKRVAYVNHEAFVRLVYKGYDPQVSVAAYQVIGEGYQKSTKWLFDPEEVQQEYLDFGNGYKHPLLPIIDDRAGINVELVAI